MCNNKVFKYFGNRSQHFFLIHSVCIGYVDGIIVALSIELTIPLAIVIPIIELTISVLVTETWAILLEKHKTKIKMKV